MQRSTLRLAHLPAPIGGVNTISAGVDMPKTDMIYCYNMIASEFGLRTRLGWREWCTGLGTPGEQVRSLLPFTGSTASGSNNRLFAVTTSGIWDVTSSSATPTQVVGAAAGWVSSSNAGWGISTTMVTAAGHFLCYCDEENGYWVYTESGATWAKITMGAGGTQINGVDPAKFVFVMPWKNRLWFVEKDTARAWYLAIGSVYGTATAFTFGSRFKAGGDLRGLWSWTYDGGAGPDDRLVAVSGAGDIVIYEGTDPASASTFGIVGVWFVGSVPAYRRLCTEVGGDVLVMSSLGILPLSRLVIGNVVYDRSQYQTFKITNLFNQLQASTSTMRGWAMRLHPTDAALMVLIPVASGQPTQQLAMSLSTRGWHRYRDMPMGVCAEAFGGSLYFGTEDGRVCVNDGYVDGVTLANPSAYSPIAWSFMTAVSNMGSIRLKRVATVKTRILSQGGGINFAATSRYGWNIEEPAAPTGVAVTAGALWGSALWGTGVWGGAYTSTYGVSGGAGCAPEVAIAVRGTSGSRMTLTGLDVSWDEGGIL